MTRILLAVLLVALATSCTGASSDPVETDTDAETFKTEMDAFARETLPKLEAEVGGEWGGFTATFVEKGGNTGRWEYTAGGGVSQPPGSREAVLDKIESVLTAQGMSVERSDDITDLTARKGNIAVQASRALDSDIESVSRMNLTFSSWDRLTSRDDFAENAGETPLLE